MHKSKYIKNSRKKNNTLLPYQILLEAIFNWLLTEIIDSYYTFHFWKPSSMAFWDLMNEKVEHARTILTLIYLFFIQERSIRDYRNITTFRGISIVYDQLKDIKYHLFCRSSMLTSKWIWIICFEQQNVHY